MILRKDISTLTLPRFSLSVAALVLGTSVLGASALAGETGDYDANRDMIQLSDRNEELFDKLDKNDNAAIERSEAQDHEQLSERFSDVDTDADEAITRSEFSAFEINDDDTASSNNRAPNKDHLLNQPPAGSSMR